MILTGIISISGRPGLYKVVAQGKNNIIVESLEDRKRFPAYSTDRISALEDISIYTYEDDKALHEIFDAIFEKEGGKECISHKESAGDLADYLLSVLPSYDQERVYSSDIKKIFAWYNILHKAGELKQEEDKAEKPAKKASKAEDKSEEAAEEKPKKAAKPKAAAGSKPKTATKTKATPKSTAGKKAVTPKGGTSRGK
jgi:hypothetical protein